MKEGDLVLFKNGYDQQDINDVAIGIIIKILELQPCRSFVYVMWSWANGRIEINKPVDLCVINESW